MKKKKKKKKIKKKSYKTLLYLPKVMLNFDFLEKAMGTGFLPHFPHFLKKKSGTSLPALFSA